MKVRLVSAILKHEDLVVPRRFYRLLVTYSYFFVVVLFSDPVIIKLLVLFYESVNFVT